uniref:Uncharacterized protein n=1 Tax=Tanacetum cinerariifolium TaxID=118510 RepID=A0A699GW51_TANCI|nr:hypothetical protein [Tanacetum cinerariifolium]
MLRKQLNKVYDPFLKARLGYENPERLKKAIAAQLKMYHGEMLHSTKLKIDSPDSEETFEDAKESLLKMRNKMNQYLLMTISEHKNKFETIENGKNLNTKFDKYKTSRTLLCVTPFPKHIAVKAKKVSNTKFNADRSKLVTSHSITKNEQSQKQSANEMYRIAKTETQTPNSKTNMNVSNSTGVESFNSVRRLKCKDNKSKDRVLKNTNEKISSTHVLKMSSSVSIDSNKREIIKFNYMSTKQILRCLKHMTGNLQLLKISLSSSWEQSASRMIILLQSLDIEIMVKAVSKEKSKKVSLPPKQVPSTGSKLKLLHMDLCGPMYNNP